MKPPAPVTRTRLGIALNSSIHPYPAQPKGVLRWAKVARRIMRRDGDGATPIWVATFGWVTGGAGFRVLPVSHGSQPGPRRRDPPRAAIPRRSSAAHEATRAGLAAEGVPWLARSRSPRSSRDASAAPD